MRKPRLVMTFILGLVVGLILNRAVALYMAASGNSLTRLTNVINQLGTSLQNAPFALSFALYPLFGLAGGFLLCMLLSLALYDSGHYMPGREHGSARWATLKELKPLANPEEKKNIILSQDIKKNLETENVPLEYQRNNNVLVVGGSGSLKTTSYVMTNLSQLHSSYVLSDTKGTLVHTTGKMFLKALYSLKCFNTNNMTNSDGFNPFVYIHDEITLKRIIKCVIDGTNSELARRGEPFWDRSEELLLGAVHAYLYYMYRGEKSIPGSGKVPHLYDVGDLIRLLEREEEDEPSVLEKLFDSFEARFGSRNYAVLQFNSFKLFRGDTRSSVLAIAISRFSMFDLGAVRDILENDTMDIESWGTQKTVVYLTLPDLDQTYNFLANILFTLAFRTLEAQADEVYHGHLPIPIRFILDEFVNLGKIPNIKEAISVFRSRWMSIDILIQSINALKAMYKDDWQSIVANCDSLVYLAGSTEKDTVQFFSERGGKMTLDKKKATDSRGAQGSYSINYDNLGRDLITPDEVYHLSRKNCLVSISSMYLYKGRKYNIKKHPRYKEWSDHYGDANWYEFHHFKTAFEMWDYYFNTNQNKKELLVEFDEADLEKEVA